MGKRSRRDGNGTRQAMPYSDQQRGTAVPEEQIRVRAYQIHLEHGGTPGHELDDWLQAERELVGSANGRS